MALRGRRRVSLVPAAGLIGEATEELAKRAGPTLGGFLNATFGNAAELIIAIAALRAHHTEIVKASITGSIIGNLLLVFGASCFAGGLAHGTQKFNRTAAGSATVMLALAVVGARHAGGGRSLRLRLAPGAARKSSTA